MISTILQYCTIDLRFLDANLNQLSKFSDEIIVPICDHLFNGTPESKELLQATYNIAAKYPKCSIYLYEWEGIKANPAYYHNLGRALGTDIAKNDWLLFVDADEIPDDSIVPWIKTAIKTDYIYWITCAWYFREPIYQSESFEGCGLLIPKSKCNWILETRAERDQFFSRTDFVHGGYNHILNEHGRPMMHHFSWVRTKKAMLDKVNNWGHVRDADWVSKIEEEFSRPFNGTDFVHKYSYKQVENIFNI